MTERLYQQNVYLKETNAVLLNLEETEDFYKAIFDKTVFFPTGGGQLCDTGTISGHNVVDVSEDKENGNVIHKLKKTGDILIQGNEYHLAIDWDKRFSHMQMHCGEHLLSGAFLKLYGAANKGFHMGEDYVTIDIDWNGKELTPEMIFNAEKLANQWVCKNIRVETRFFKTAEEAMSLPCRKKIKFGKNIYVVLIGDETDPADCCACCGTHPSFTGEIGLIKVTHTEKYKSMTRMYVKCGEKALVDCSFRQSILEKIAKRYSCDIEDLESTLDAADRRNDELYKKYSNLKKQLISAEKKQIQETLTEKSCEKVLTFKYSQYEINDLQDIVKDVTIASGQLLVLISVESTACLLVSSGDPDCGKIVKEKASAYSGKGGGKPSLARAVFKDMSSLHDFVFALK